MGDLHFALKDGAWTSEATLPFWSGFLDCRGPSAGVVGTASDGTVPVVLCRREPQDASPMTARERAAMSWAIAQHEELGRKMLSAFLEDYGKLREHYLDPPWAKKHPERLRPDHAKIVAASMPPVSCVDAFRALVGPGTMYVHVLEGRPGDPCVGMELGCTWDEEHGLGIVVHGSGAVEWDGAALAFCDDCVD